MSLKLKGNNRLSFSRIKMYLLYFSLCIDIYTCCPFLRWLSHCHFLFYIIKIHHWWLKLLSSLTSGVVRERDFHPGRLRGEGVLWWGPDCNLHRWDLKISKFFAEWDAALSWAVWHVVWVILNPTINIKKWSRVDTCDVHKPCITVVTSCRMGHWFDHRAPEDWSRPWRWGPDE